MRRSTMRFFATRAAAGDGNVGSTVVTVKEGAISPMSVWQHVAVTQSPFRVLLGT
jgi:hypothetical protein